MAEWQQAKTCVAIGAEPLSKPMQVTSAVITVNVTTTCAPIVAGQTGELQVTSPVLGHFTANESIKSSTMPLE